MESELLPSRADFPTSLLYEVFHQRLVQTPPSPRCKVCAIVPVRNEAQTLELTLTALAHQVDFKGQPLDPTSYEIILLANNCSDDSAAIARLFARQPSWRSSAIAPPQPRVSSSGWGATTNVGLWAIVATDRSGNCVGAVSNDAGVSTLGASGCFATFTLSSASCSQPWALWSGESSRTR